MAFTLKIESKGLLWKKRSINMNKLLNNCKLKYGSSNEFYILEENKMNQGTAVLYNPDRIGRGIFFDASKISDGQITISYNIPTTKAEIHDFIQVSKEIESQFKKASFSCEEENKDYTIMSLEENEEAMVAYSLESLHNFCENEEFTQCVLTLAQFPWFMDSQKREIYKACQNLDDFETTIHNLQTGDVYYAKPSLMHNNTDGKNYACYVMTAECESIFPTEAEGFINLDNIQIDGGLIQFYIFEEEKLIDGMYSYEKFVEYMLNHGAKKFDAIHMKVPGNITKEEIYKIIEYINC